MADVKGLDSGSEPWRVQQVMPATLGELLKSTDQEIVSGAPGGLRPIPTGFNPLDGILGGGVSRGDMVIIGGPQGVGKTIFSLQVARNMAADARYPTLYVCYEHSRKHLMSRLLCLEAGMRAGPGQAAPALLKLNELMVAVAQHNQHANGGPRLAFREALRKDPQWAPALAALESYADRLYLVKASSVTTTLGVLRRLAEEVMQRSGSSIALFVDYLQKVSIDPLSVQNEAEKTTILSEGLKDIAMTLEIPVIVLAAADREGLKATRMRLHDLRGSSAIQYESDVVIILNNKYQIVSKNHITYNPAQAQAFRNWVVFSVEKNRGGPAMIDLEFAIDPMHFRFATQGGYVREQLIDQRIASE
jgi:replicative DNA helicase